MTGSETYKARPCLTPQWSTGPLKGNSHDYELVTLSKSACGPVSSNIFPASPQSDSRVSLGDDEGAYATIPGDVPPCS